MSHRSHQGVNKAKRSRSPMPKFNPGVVLTFARQWERMKAEGRMDADLAGWLQLKLSCSRHDAEKEAEWAAIAIADATKGAD